MDQNDKTPSKKMRNIIGPVLLAFVAFPFVLQATFAVLPDIQYPYNLLWILWGFVVMAVVLWCSEVWYRQIKRDNEALFLSQ
jgi:O-antigen/teichoic acid export membrane protein